MANCKPKDPCEMPNMDSLRNLLCQDKSQTPYPPSNLYGNFYETQGHAQTCADDGGELPDYKDVKATINGHTVNMKIARRKKEKKNQGFPMCQMVPACEESSEEVVCPPPPPPPQPPKLNLCSCDLPIPPELIPQPPPPPPPPPQKKKKKQQPQCPLQGSPQTGAMCLNANCPMGLPMPPGFPQPKPPSNFPLGPGAFAIKGEQVFYRDNEPNQNPPPAEYKISKGNDKGNTLNRIRMTPEKPEPVITEDEDNDIFSIRIGKKNLLCDDNPEFELELKTPKVKVQKVSVAENSTQYLDTDVPPPEKPAGGKGGKGGKKGKKK